LGKRKLIKQESNSLILIAPVDIRVLLVFTTNMYQYIAEPIEVAGVFAKSTFTPKKFLWKKREYLISQITLKSDTKDGGVRKRLYSVVVGRELYRLTYNRDLENWLLEEVWIDQ
jgi:hypothetical protein